uniref:Uncharacterized protein n=1 Tax=Setaria italica TaxID=4555 RepID=K3ZL43_SETIT
MQYYIGEVRSGAGIANLKGAKATILCFEGAETGKNLHDCLSSVSHTHVMKSLGYGSGQKRFSRYQFLALPFFGSTFEEYIKESWKCVEMGRFTMEIIMIVGMDILKHSALLT